MTIYNSLEEMAQANFMTGNVDDSPDGHKCAHEFVGVRVDGVCMSPTFQRIQGDDCPGESCASDDFTSPNLVELSLTPTKELQVICRKCAWPLLPWTRYTVAGPSVKFTKQGTAVNGNA